MAKESPAQKETVERVMHEFKHGELKSNGGRKVTNPKQAIAVALHEAGASNQESPAKNGEDLRQTKAKEHRGGTGGARGRPSGSGEPSRADLYARARQMNVPGRSRMSKEELQQAVHH
jgi:hypothetical protein